MIKLFLRVSLLLLVGGVAAHGADTCDGELRGVSAGVVNVLVQPGTHALLSSPFMPVFADSGAVSNGLVTTASGRVPDCRLYRWDCRLQCYLPLEGVTAASRGLFFTSLPGDAFFVHNVDQEVVIVALWGQVVPDDTVSLDFFPGLNLFAYPFSSSPRDGDPDTAGSFGHQATANGDETFSFLDGLYRTWADGADVNGFDIGHGHWYKRNTEECISATFTRPYAVSLFNADEPVLTGMCVGDSGEHLTLLFEAQAGTGTIFDVLARCIDAPGCLDIAAGWNPVSYPVTAEPEEGLFRVAVPLLHDDMALEGAAQATTVRGTYYMIRRGNAVVDRNGGDSLASPDVAAEARVESTGGVQLPEKTDDTRRIYVSASGGDNRFDGKTRESDLARLKGPKQTIRAGRQAASVGDELVVIEGVYHEKVIIPAGVVMRCHGKVIVQ